MNEEEAVKLVATLATTLVVASWGTEAAVREADKIVRLSAEAVKKEMKHAK